MDEFELQEKIEAYWCQTMSPEERTSFELQMQSDTVMSAQVEDWRLVFLATDRLAQKDLQMHFKKWKKEIDQPDIAKKKSIKMQLITMSVLLFFIFSLLVAFWFYQQRQPAKGSSTKTLVEQVIPKDTIVKSNVNTKSDSIQNKNTSPDYDQWMAMARQEQAGTFAGTASRGIDEHQTNLTSLERGREALINGQAKQALAELNKVAKNDPDFAEVLFLKGHAFFILGDYESTVSNFKIYLSINPQNDLVEYNLLVTYLATRKVHENDFQTLLMKIKSDPEHTYYNKVSNLEKKL